MVRILFQGSKSASGELAALRFAIIAAFQEQTTALPARRNQNVRRADHPFLSTEEFMSAVDAELKRRMN